MTFSDQLAKRYANIFSLPSRKVMIAEMFLLAIVLSVVVNAIVPNSQGPIFGVLDGFFSLALGSLLCTYIIFQVVGNGILNFRRSIALTTVSIVILAIGFFAGALASWGFNNSLIFVRTYFISCGVIVAYLYILLAVLSQTSQIKLLILSFLQPLIILIFHSVLIYEIYSISVLTILTYFIGFAIMGLVAYVLGRWFYSSIEKVGKDLLGYGSVVLFKAFLDAFMLDKTGVLELLLKALAIREDIEVRTLSFKSKTQEGMLVAPLIHPGPFGDLGSSKLPTKIATQFLEKQVYPVIFHTPTTHDKDLVLAKDCERVMQNIFSMEGGETEGLAGPPIVKTKGAITVNCQVFDGIPLTVITRSPLPTEDLPDFVHAICMKEILENGYPDGILVDAHNAMDTIYTDLTEQDKTDLLDALSSALEEAKIQGEKKFHAGFANAKLEGYTSLQGIGDGGIMALLTQVGVKQGVYISVDANNMVVGLREKIREVVIKMGYDFCEITTTDTHIVTGHSRGEAYFPLGKAIPEGVLIDKIISVVKEADSKKSECLVKFSKRKVEDVYLFGNKGIENIWKVTDKTIKVAKERVATLAVLSITFGIVFIFLFSLF